MIKKETKDKRKEGSQGRKPRKEGSKESSQKEGRKEGN